MKLKTNLPYEEVSQFSVRLGKELLEVVSKPGLPDWDQVLPSAELLAEYPGLRPTDHVLLFGCHHGALGVVLARRLSDGHLCIIDNNFIALEMTRRTLVVNNISSVKILTDVDLPEALCQRFNAVFIQIPKGRKLTRRWLLQAHQALVLGGNLYLAGSNKSGVQSVIKDAMGLFGDGHILAYKKGNRVAHLTKKIEHSPLPDWVNAPGITPETWMEFSISLSNRCYQIRSLPGVFSFDHLDDGTKMLLSVINIPTGAKVLDVGCGYGIIGLFAAVQGAGWVDLIDNDLLAIAACKATLSLNQVTNTAVLIGDLLETIGSNRYDLILSNPPFHAGQAVEYQIALAMIKQSYQALNVGGQITIVANRFIHYDRMINEIFGNVSCLAESGKFHVLSAIKSG